MAKCLIIAGFLINLVYNLVNRHIRKLPDWLAIPVLLVGIALMITGAFLSGR